MEPKELLNGLKNKKVRLFYNDGSRVTPKEGIVQYVNSSFIILNTDRGTEAIQISRIIRMEIEGSGKDGKQQ